jgi:uncharacterized membrane protein (DUF373 family)
MSLCKYKNIFGKPNEGAHSYRIFDIAIVDVVATIIIAKLISDYYNYDFYKTLGTLFIIGIIAHRIFCVRTKIDKILFPNEE